MPLFYEMEETESESRPFEFSRDSVDRMFYYSCHYERVTIHIVDYHAMWTIKGRIRKSVSVEVNPCHRPVYLGLYDPLSHARRAYNLRAHTRAYAISAQPEL